MAESLREALTRNVEAASSSGDDAGGSSQGVTNSSISPPSSASDSAPATETTTTQPAASEAPKTGDRPRGSDGKFAKPDAGSSQTPPAVGETKTPDPAAKPTDAAPDTGAPVLPPRGWGKETHEDWKALPRKLQERVVQRETERDRYLNQETAKVKQSQTYYAQLHEVLGPRTQDLIARFGGVAPAVARLFQLSDAADRAPEDFIKWLAKGRGIDLASLVAGAPEPAAVDPHYAAMQAELGQVKQALLGFGKTFQTNAQAQEQQAQKATLQAISRWAGETEADGTAKRPYFDRLEPYIHAVLPRIIEDNPGLSQADTLQAAYDAAVHANPETRQAVMTQAENKRLAEEHTKRARATQQAQLAGSGITGSTAPTGGSVPPKTVREGLERNLAKAMGRVAA